MYTANYKRRTKNKWSKGKREYQRSQLKALIRQDQIALHAPEETARIKQLLNDLTKLGEFPKDSKSIIQFTVRFFNIISFFQDDGLIQYQPNSVADLVEVANKVITVCGRQPTKTSWNQSNRGEKVTLDNAMLGELLLFSNNVYGMVMNLEEDSVGVVILGDDSKIKEGDIVRRTSKVVEVPVGDELLGRVVNLEIYIYIL